jgi:hypothetical protein
VSAMVRLLLVVTVVSFVPLNTYIVQKMLSPALGSLVKTLGTIPHEPDADHTTFKAAAIDFSSNLQRLSLADTIIDREMQRFAPIAEGVVKTLDMAASRGFTIEEFAREQLRAELGEKESLAVILVPKAIEKIGELRLETPTLQRSHTTRAPNTHPAWIPTERRARGSSRLSRKSESD